VDPIPAVVVATQARDFAEAKANPDAGKVLADLVGPYLHTEQVGIAEIESMVNEAWAKRAVPVTVDIKRGDVVTTLPGLHHKSLPDVLANLTVGENTMMVGPAATGKSTIAEQCAEALGVDYYAISLSPQTPTSAFLGYMNAGGEYVDTLFHQWHQKGGLFHCDEADNGHPSILATLDAALSGAGWVGFPGGMQRRHPDAIMVASANTYGRGADRKYVGRSPLDVAFLDRFTVEDIGYDEALEDALAAGTGCPDWARVVAVVRRLRTSAENHAMPVVFSPRASVGICKLLIAGRTWDACVAGRLRRGISDTDWAKVTDGKSVTL
jgi:cobaltochelatase CobS